MSGHSLIEQPSNESPREHASSPNFPAQDILRLDFSFPHRAKLLGFQQVPHSLGDGDIIVVRPPTLPFNCVLAGKESLCGSEALQFLDRCDHWRGEMQQALKAGKTIFVFCSQPLAAVGENPHHPEEKFLFSNYRLLPIENPAKVFVPRRGRRTQLVGGQDAFTKFWNEFRERTEYHAQFRDLNLKPLVRTGDGAGIVGGFLEYPNEGRRSGFLVLLPEMDLGKEPGEDEPDCSNWLKRNKAFELHLRRVDRELRLSPEEEAIPDWAGGVPFQLESEAEIRREISMIEQNITEQSARRDSLLSALNQERRLKALLFAKGRDLEVAVRLAFQILGFEVDHFQAQDFEFDCLLNCEEGRLLCEVEGKDSQPIDVDKIRQLTENLNHDTKRNTSPVPAKGVLCGNAFRQFNPSDRGPFFTEPCVYAAREMKVALLRSPDLFVVAKYVLEYKNKEFAKRCRQCILESEGTVVSFPQTPNR